MNKTKISNNRQWRKKHTTLYMETICLRSNLCVTDSAIRLRQSAKGKWFWVETLINRMRNNNKWQHFLFRFGVFFLIRKFFLITIFSLIHSIVQLQLLFCFDSFSCSFVMASLCFSLICLATHFNLLNSKQNNFKFQFVYCNLFK